ncbi:MAG: flagellar biosynthesis protein FlhB [Deltaproteobacteria bacterium]|nr:flagellar biosynthesis protein FlhB [Deltaproteobacteria bacterium]
MSRGSDQEKSEPATPKRLQEMREKGQVAKSREVPSVAVLIASLLVFYFLGSTMFKQLMDLMQWVFTSSGSLQIKEANIQWLLIELLGRGLKVLAPLLIALVAMGLVSNYLQVGFLFSFQSIAPKFSKLDPLKGFAKMFSKQTLVELVKNIFKVMIVGCVAYFTVKGELNHIVPLMDMEVWSIMSYIGSVCFKIMLSTSWVLILLAFLDYIFQRWDFQQEAKMSKQEVKDEFKQREGDPLIKSRVRQAQREMARRRMMEAVPKADVVITNPAHLAIALEYNTQKMMSPKVIAKGTRLMAERIKEVARQNQVPIVENKPLAQALFASVEIGQEIPVVFYKAVAEILSYVYRLKNKRMLYGSAS